MLWLSAISLKPVACFEPLRSDIWWNFIKGLILSDTSWYWGGGGFNIVSRLALLVAYVLSTIKVILLRFILSTSIWLTLSAHLSFLYHLVTDSGVCASRWFSKNFETDSRGIFLFPAIVRSVFGHRHQMDSFPAVRSLISNSGNMNSSSHFHL